ncbi:MAG: YciI family protein [Rhizobiales bacterium]|nr:YciI family protein [Hyphomicrobiales bacterium]
MPYLIDATDKPDSADLRAKTRPEHMEFLKASLPKLIAAGAKLRDDGTTAWGSAYIVDVDDRASAEAFINADPFTKAGLFGDIRITRWRKGFFDFKQL